MTRHVPVLIAGGGTVGLAAALFLARQGVPALAVERHPDLSAHPRASGLNARSVELFRSAGLEHRLTTEVSRSGQSGVISVRTLAGADLATTERGGLAEPEDYWAVTPVSPLAGCSQDRLDAMTLQAAREEGAAVWFRTELAGFAQDDRQVTATLAQSSRTHEITADYLIAADGSGSSVRRQLGISSTGPGPLGNPMISVLFRADLSDLLGGQGFALCKIVNPSSPGILVSVNGVDRWIFHIHYDADSGQTAEEFPESRCRELIQIALGGPERAIDIVSVLPWESTARTAEEFRRGRVFLAGDAAHVVPPTGGFGLNTGLADVHNLAWKLATVLAGMAGPGLLDSYQRERRPVALTTMDQSLLRGQHRELHWDLRPERAEERRRVGMLNFPVLIFGYHYSSDAVVGSREELPSTERPERCLDGCAGTRLPHLWIRRPEGPISTLDLVDGQLTLLTGSNGTRWSEAAKTVTAHLSVPLEVHHIADAELKDAQGTWTATVGIADDGALLVRPDHFTAWRCTHCPEDPETVLSEIVCRILGLPRGNSADRHC